MALTQVQGGMIVPSTTLTTPIVATTMGVGGATPAASGSGITFPATASASSDANTLDDYEEGTWTPTYAFSISGSVTQAITSGRYTKIGNIVHLSCRIATASISSPTGGCAISGLPFTSASGSNYGVAIGQASSFVSALTIRAQIEPSSIVIDILKNASNAAGAGLQGSDFSSGGNQNLLDLTVTYRAA